MKENLVQITFRENKSVLKSDITRAIGEVFFSLSQVAENGTVNIKSYSQEVGGYQTQSYAAPSYAAQKTELKPEEVKNL